MDEPQPAPSQPDAGSGPQERSAQDLVADRRAKLQRLREEFGIDPYGHRVGHLLTLQEARQRYDEQADEAYRADSAQDQRPRVRVAGRVMLKRLMGNLIFMTLRDATGDLQAAISKKAVSPQAFQLAKLTDLSDIVVVEGPLGKTKTGEITVWAEAPAEAGGSELEPAGFTIATKSLAPPPEKWHGLQDPELRYRRRYVDLYVNPSVMQTFQQRSRILKRIRDFLTDPPAEVAAVTGGGFIEVETPMMQPIAGGAAARPFITHHNALDIDLYLRIAPELYLKRLLVGGLPRVFEINRNFRNEGLSPRHNPEFTMLELYQAFGDYRTMMELTERLVHTVAVEVAGQEVLPWGEHSINCRMPFRRATYLELFEEHNGFAASDTTKLVERAGELGIASAGKDHDVLLQEVWEETVERYLIQPVFVMDYPAKLCPLTKTKAGNPHLAERFELYIAGMEMANAYTELNDPDVQEANFRQQIAGLDEEESTFRTVDEDFLQALRVGMPPAGG
ncbi:MAG TPA: lysine--tRNA ligase, partial [Phycisphaeraceae bacterium]